MCKDASSEERVSNPGQEQVANTFSGNIAVNAGAGTGKTTTLTQRFVNALMGSQDRPPMRVSEILAITYTKTAARELLGRVRNELRVKVNQAPDPEVRARLLSCMRDMDSAWVSTIHGFCARVLRAHAYEVGLDPSFSQLEPEDQKELLSGAIAEIKSEAVEDSKSMLGLTEAGYSDKLAAMSYTRAKENVVAESLARALYELRTVLGERDLWKTVGELIDAPVTYGVSIEDIQTLKLGDDAPPDDILVFAMAYRLLRVAALVKTAYERRKREKNVVDFGDLLVFTNRLLSDSQSSVASRLSERFKMVMIDEFQDTNRFQLNIFSRIADGRLCTVGDQNQSIYSFQGADVQVIVDETDKRRAASEDVVSLDVNYRSHPDVISFVNAFFGQLFEGKLVKLSAGKSPDIVPIDADEKRVTLARFSPAKESGVNAQDLCGLYIAREFKKLADKGVPYKDMVVLVYTRNQGRPILDAFEKLGIPAQISGGGEFYSQPTVLEALLFLKVVRNPHDDLSFLGLCLSEFGRVSNQDMADIGKERKSWTGEAPRSLYGAAKLLADERPDRCKNLKNLIGTIKEARAGIATTGVDELLRRAWACRGMFSYYSHSGLEGKQKWADLRKFREIARSFERSQASVVDFIEYVDRQTAVGSKVEPGIWPQEDGVVRILTIHESKGQEFPVVAVFAGSKSYRSPSTPPIVRISAEEASVSGYDTSPALKTVADTQGDTEPVSVCGDDGSKVIVVTKHIGLGSSKSKKGEHGLFGYAKDQIEKRAVDEYLRLLYVGCTRAEERLFIVYDADFKNNKHLAHHIEQARNALSAPELATQGTEDFLRVSDSAYNPASESDYLELFATDGDKAEGDEVLQPRKLLVLDDYEGIAPKLQQRTKTLSQASYSHLAELEQCPWAFWWSHVERIGSTPTDIYSGLEAQRKMTASEIGSVVHLILEQAEGDKFDELAVERTLDVMRVPTDARASIVQRASMYLQHPIRQRLNGCSSVVKEKQFYIPIGGNAGERIRYIHGYMDAYGVDPDGSAIVVDYKVSDSEIEFGKYRIQAECYALAAMLQGAKTVEVVFAQIAKDELIVHDLPEFRFEASDIPRLEEQLLEQFRRIDAMNDCLAIKAGMKWSTDREPRFGTTSCVGCVIDDRYKPCLTPDPDNEHCYSYCTMPRAFCWVKQGSGDKRK